MKGVDVNACTFSSFSRQLAISGLAPFYHYEWEIPLSQQCTSAGVCLKLLAYFLMFWCQLAISSLAPFYHYEWEISLSQQCTSSGVCFGANLPSPVWLPFIIRSRGVLCLSDALQQEFVRKCLPIFYVLVPTCRFQFGSLLSLGVGDSSVSAMPFSRSLFENACLFSMFWCQLAVSSLAPFYH